MKLFNGFSPNGFRVAAFMHEKGIELPTETVDVMKGETRQETHLARNSLGEIPVLQLDDGTFISESIAICRYLEALNPEPALFGSNPEEAARIEMWNRRMEQQIFGICGDYGLHVIPVFADKVEQMPEYAESRKRALQSNWEWLDKELSDGRTFVAGEKFSVADISGMAALMIYGFIEALELPENLEHVGRWVTEVRERPSFSVFSR